MRESVCMREKRAIRKVDFKLYENLHNLQIGPIKITFFTGGHCKAFDWSSMRIVHLRLIVYRWTL